MSAESERLVAELRFVAARYLKDGSGANFRADRCTGTSSDALAWYGVDQAAEPTEEKFPRDQSDLAACLRTYDMAPQHVQDRMRPVLERYREYVEAATRAAHAERATEETR